MSLAQKLGTASLGRLVVRSRPPVVHQPQSRSLSHLRVAAPGIRSDTCRFSQPNCRGSLTKAAFSTTTQASSAGENANFTAQSTGGIPYPGIPKIEDPYEKRQWQLEHLAGAFRVFARKGFTEGAAGHITVRDTVDPDTFWINP